MPHLIVCPECEGTGRDASTAYVITQEDLDIQCGDDYESRRDFVASVASLTQRCPLCLGRNVVTTSDADEWAEEAYERNLIAQEQYYERMAGC
jgi:hypothetical protein